MFECDCIVVVTHFGLMWVFEAPTVHKVSTSLDPFPLARDQLADLLTYGAW